MLGLGIMMGAFSTLSEWLDRFSEEEDRLIVNVDGMEFNFGELKFTTSGRIKFGFAEPKPNGRLM